MRRLLARPGRWRLIVAAAGLCVVGACASSGPNLTGLGATKAVWDAHHTSGHATVITDHAGRVDGFLLVLPVGTLVAAEARVRQELPSDATAGPAVLMVGIEGTKCEIVDFTSPTLRRALGGDHGDRVMAVFETDAATVMDTNLITQASVVSANANFPRRC